MISLSIGVGIIFTNNGLVDRTRNFKSNASRFKQKNHKKNAPQARFLRKQNAPQARFIKQNAPQARIFDEVPMGILSYLYIELPAKLLDYFLRSNKSNINQNSM